MFIKAGIVVATAAAGILAVSPMAFASDGHHHHHHGGADVQGGLVNLQHIGAQVPVQLCNNSVAEGALGILSWGTHNDDSHDGKCKQHNSDDD